jgi:Domain of unknown function (DUF4189)
MLRTRFQHNWFFNAALRILAAACGLALVLLLPMVPANADMNPGDGCYIAAFDDHGTAIWVCPHNQAPTPPPKPDVWGALAVSPANPTQWGNSWNYKTEQAARAEALRQCRLSAKDCTVAATVADVCVALVVSARERIYKVGGPTGATNFASDNGMLQCRRAGGSNCIVATSFCADGVNHVLNGQTVYSNGNPIFVPNGQGNPGFGRRR